MKSNDSQTHKKNKKKQKEKEVLYRNFGIREQQEESIYKKENILQEKRICFCKQPVTSHSF